MGIGAFSSESDTRITTTSKAFNTGFSEVGGQATSINLSFSGAVGKKARPTFAPVINLTDQGALAKASEIAAQSAQSVQELGSTLADTIGSALAYSRESTGAAVGAALESRRGEVESIALNVAKWGALVAVAFFAARAFGKG